MEKSFKDVIRELRTDRGHTQSEVAQLLDLKVNTYQSYERGQSEPSIDTINKLANLYGVTTDYLLGRVPAEAELLTEAETELERRLLEQYHKLPEKYRKQYLEGVRQAVEMQKQEDGSLGPMTHSATIGELLEAAKSESEAKKGA